MFYTIYRITCKTTGKTYIGKHQTKNVNDDYMGSGKLLAYAKDKYGLENFSKEILYIFNSEDEMNAKEAELVTEEFCAREDTYNVCPGGKGGWGYINSTITQDQRMQRAVSGNIKHVQLLKTDEDYRHRYSSKISSSLKTKYKEDEDYRIAAKSAALKGSAAAAKVASNPETRKKKSESLKGKFTGVNNSFSKQVLANGIIYESKSAAIKALHISEAKLNKLIASGEYQILKRG